jgi:hypothetical protein
MTVTFPEEENQAMPKKVGSFRDPNTGRQIDVYPKRNESAATAIARVRRKHGLIERKPSAPKK